MSSKTVRLFQSTRFKKFLLILLLFATVFLVFDLVIMPWYVDHGATQQVPSVIGIRDDAAWKLLDSAGFEPVRAETRPDPKAPAGTVVAQNPGPDALVKHGRRVYLSISGGEIMVEAPKLRGLSSRDARFALERSGLRLGPITYAPSDTYFQNTIMDQSVPPGTKVTKGEAIGITISRGGVAKSKSAPDLTGKTVSEAEKILAAEGLKVGKITYQTGFNLIPNTIIDQFPRPGDQVQHGSALDLFVAKLTANKQAED